MNYPKKQLALIGFLLFGTLLLVILLIVTRAAPSAEEAVREEEASSRSSGALIAPRLPRVLEPVSSTRIMSRDTEVVNSIAVEEIKALPPTGPAYQLSGQLGVNKRVGEMVAANLDNPGPPERVDEDTLEWLGDKYDVIVNEKEKYIFVFKQVPEYSLPAPSIPSAISTARDFLRESGLLQEGLIIDERGAVLIRINSNEMRKTLKSGESYNAVYVPVVPLASFTSVSDSLINYPRQVVVDGRGEVLRLWYSLEDAKAVESGTYELKPFNDAYALAISGKFEPVVDYPLETYDQAVPKIGRFEFKNVRVVLFETRETKEPLQPVYEFSGIAALDNGDTAPFTIFVPAIAP